MPPPGIVHCPDASLSRATRQRVPLAGRQRRRPDAFHRTPCPRGVARSFESRGHGAQHRAVRGRRGAPLRPSRSPRPVANFTRSVKLWHHPGMAVRSCSARAAGCFPPAAHPGSGGGERLTPRSIRYYEELGLLHRRPAPSVYRSTTPRSRRSGSSAAFATTRVQPRRDPPPSEDEEARIRDGERFRASGDVDERRAILRDLIARVDRQVAGLEEKAERIVAMIDVAAARRAHLRAHLAELEGGPPAHDEGAPHPVTGP